MIKDSLLPVLLFIFIRFNTLLSQNTLGLLGFDPSLTYAGYNLFYPLNQPNVYLLNNCGEIVHECNDTNAVRPANTAYLLDDDRLIVCKG